MSYGIWCTVMGAGLLFASPYWWLQVIGGLASVAGLLMMAGEEKTMKKVHATGLSVDNELLRRTSK